MSMQCDHEAPSCGGHENAYLSRWLICSGQNNTATVAARLRAVKTRLSLTRNYEMHDTRGKFTLLLELREGIWQKGRQNCKIRCFIIALSTEYCYIPQDSRNGISRACNEYKGRGILDFWGNTNMEYLTLVLIIILKRIYWVEWKDQWGVLNAATNPEHPTRARNPTTSYATTAFPRPLQLFGYYTTLLTFSVGVLLSQNFVTVRVFQYFKQVQ
jgi:hypothetical protein